MSFDGVLVAAFHSLHGNRLRSLLTTLGIVVGVASVIVLVGIGNGVRAGTDEMLSRTANSLQITKATGSIPGGGAPRDLIDSDVRALRDRSAAPHLADVVPTIEGSAILTHDQIQLKSPIIGSTPDYPRVLDREIQAGHWFDAADEKEKAKVAIIGPDAVSLLYPPHTGVDSVLGSTVRISRTDFKVIGVMAASGWNDNAVFVPLGAARAYVSGGINTVNSIYLKATTTADVPAAKAELTGILDSRHFIRDPRQRDYDIRSYATQVARQAELVGLLTIFTVAVAAISLVVGGIGVANIMLVSVTERTREIGIRKAIGAPKRTILTQFLTEAVVLTGLGGLTGATLGAGMVISGKWIMPIITRDYPPPILSPLPVVIAFTISLVIGIVAGVYPAHRAARLRPIEALRFE